MGATKSVAEVSLTSNKLTRVHDGGIRKTSADKSTKTARKSQSTATINLANDGEQNAIQASSREPTKSAGASFPIAMQPLVSVTQDTSPMGTKAIGHEKAYMVIRYQSSLYGESEEVLGTFSTIARANLVVSQSFEDLEVFKDGEWGECHYKSHSNGAIYMWINGIDSGGDVQTLTTQTLEQKPNKVMSPLGTVFVVTEERREHISQFPNYRLESRDVLDVFRNKDLANWYVRRRGDLRQRSLISVDCFEHEKHTNKENGLYEITVTDDMEDEQIVITTSAQTLR